MEIMHNNEQKDELLPSAHHHAKPMLSVGNFVQADDDVKIGKMYNVRCAVMTNGYKGSKDYLMPVIGDIHVDKDFAPFTHIHIDGRFCGYSESRKIIINEKGQTSTVCSYKESGSLWYIKEFVIKRKKCVRKITGLPLRKGVEIETQSVFFDWAKTMIGKSCKGKKCPHLGTSMIEENGSLICPIHNLRGCVDSQVIVGLAYR